MNVGETIRTQYPLNLAKLYEAVRLEGEPRLRVSRLVDLYEETVRHLTLVGLAVYEHQGLSADSVEAARADLSRPSLGHWVALLKTVDEALGRGFDLLTPPPNKRHTNDAVAAALFISPSTARTHLQRVFKKLGVHSRAEVVGFAVRCGLDIEGDV